MVIRLREILDDADVLDKLISFIHSKCKLFKTLPKEEEQTLKAFEAYMGYVEVIEPFINSRRV